MQRLPLRQILFRGDERLYHDLYFDCIFIDLGNDRQSDGIHGNLRENGFPYHITYKKYCQSIAFFFFSQPFSLVKQQEVMVRDKKKTDKFPTRSTGYCVVPKGASPQTS